MSSSRTKDGGETALFVVITRRWRHGQFASGAGRALNRLGLDVVSPCQALHGVEDAFLGGDRLFGATAANDALAEV